MIPWHPAAAECQGIICKHSGTPVIPIVRRKIFENRDQVDFQAGAEHDKIIAIMIIAIMIITIILWVEPNVRQSRLRNGFTRKISPIYSVLNGFAG
jgi:hypothetical protein